MRRSGNKFLCLAALLALLPAGCGEMEGQNGAMPKAETEAEAYGLEEYYRITEADQETGGKERIPMPLEGQPPLITFEEPGDYVLSGSYEGRIVVDSEDQIVHLILDGVDIKSNEGPAIYVASAGKVVVTLAEGSENTVRDTPNYGEYHKMQACIFSTSDLTINGSGSLSVYGYRKDAVRSKDVIKILGGKIGIWSKRDGIRASDGAVIMPDSLSVESEGNGIRTTKKKKERRGFLDICGGEVTVIAGEYALSSASDLWIRQCSVSCQGIYADLFYGGEQFIEKGCLNDE